MHTHDDLTIQMAILGHRAEADRLEQSLNGRKPAPKKAASAPRKKRRISAEGRARIAAAQRKRWAKKKKAD